MKRKAAAVPSQYHYSCDGKNVNAWQQKKTQRLRWATCLVHSHMDYLHRAQDNHDFVPTLCRAQWMRHFFQTKPKYVYLLTEAADVIFCVITL
jgi:hypothetical protein